MRHPNFENLRGAERRDAWNSMTEAEKEQWKAQRHTVPPQPKEAPSRPNWEKPTPPPPPPRSQEREKDTVDYVPAADKFSPINVGIWCASVGAILVALPFPLVLFFLYGPLFFASSVLAIIGMSKGETVNGTKLLLTNLIGVPVLIGLVVLFMSALGNAKHL